MTKRPLILELLTPCYGDGVNPGTPNYPQHAAYENLDPTRETTYEFIEKLFREIIEKTSKDDHIHLGMDEVRVLTCKSVFQAQIF